jgi:hypothetical protein
MHMYTSFATRRPKRYHPTTLVGVGVGVVLE